ncbi:MAG: hypothetical protein [Bacteriophage sp.]|nr:MAG: hypothetical protein [Bacteriophage sp.]
MSQDFREYRINFLKNRIAETEKQLKIDIEEYRSLENQKKETFDKMMGEKHGVDCSGMCNTFYIHRSDLDPSTLRYWGLIGHADNASIDNPKIKALIDAGLISVGHAWLDYEGNTNYIDDECYQDLINPETPYYDPIAGDDTSKEHVMDSIIPTYSATALYTADAKKIWEVLSEQKTN